jgi:hypothetical protein
MFVNPEKNDFRLKTGSPAINAGLRIEYNSETDAKQTDIGVFPLWNNNRCILVGSKFSA